MGKIKVAIDCRIQDTRQGIGTAFLALAHGLTELDIDDQEYTFIVYQETADWLRSYLPNVRILALSSPAPSRLKAAVTKFPALRSLVQKLRNSPTRVPTSDGLIESNAFDVVHFPTQAAYLTSVPSIYQPWDLQHRHYPEFFTPAEIATRDLLYMAYCQQAKFVCVQTKWGMHDVIDQFALPADKVRVIRWGSAFETYTPPANETVSKVLSALNLPPEFFLYPAVTWPHKNHQVILRALALLKQKYGNAPHVVFTGALTDFHPKLLELQNTLGIADLTHFLGFVTTEQIQSLYQSALAMLFPSKFEGLGLPVLEAFRSGLPVLAAKATVLPEVAADAALFFDPDSPEQLAERMHQLRHSQMQRTQLVSAGRAILENYSAAQAAREFANLYLEAAQKGR